jgi:hypothetical protein
MHEPRARHRLDRRAHPDRPEAPLDPPREPGQAVGVGRRHPDLDALAARIEQAIVQPPAAEIQTSMQHHVSGPPSRSLLG